MRPKLQFFVWKLVRNMLHIRVKLKKLGMTINRNCSFCSNIEENIELSFTNCEFAMNVWLTIDNQCPITINTNLGIVDWLEYLWKNKTWLKKNFAVRFRKIYYNPLRYLDS